MTALGPFGQVRGIDLEIGAGQIIKQHVEIGVEQIAPAPDQMREQRFLMLQQQVVTGIKLVLFRKAEVRPQQIGHRAVAEPLAMQPPFAARRDQPVSRENLQNLVPARLLPARRLFALNRKKLRKTRRREGRYLLRTNLTDNDPAQLWQYYTQLVAVEEAFRNLKGDLAIRPIFHQDEKRIEAHILIAFLAYCMQITLTRRLHALAPGLTARSALEKFAAVQMIDVHLPTTDGREIRLTRYTHPEPELQLLIDQLKLRLPPQPPPRITTADLNQVSRRSEDLLA
jgi:hypothetical protein